MRFFNTIYLLLLIYIIAALLFWGFSLHRQSMSIYDQQIASLREHVDSVQKPVEYNEALKQIEAKKSTRTKQYLGEGITFLLVILVGAGVVYTSFLRSIRLGKQQHNFMLSVTHELKSPIAAMKLNLQTLEKYSLDEQKKNLLIERCINESNRLNDLCNNMLIASQMEGQQYVQAKEKLDFSLLTEQAVKEYTQRYPQRFSAEIEKSRVVYGDRLLLQLAINNILENAVKYTPDKTEILVSLTKKNNSVCLKVADRGGGIPDAEKKKIFNKFYRVGSENTRTTKGTGLGLYLTKKIVTTHKGTISVKDNHPAGSIFEISLPLS